MDSLQSAQREYLLVLSDELEQAIYSPSPSYIAQRLARAYEDKEHLAAPSTLREFRGRMQHLARRAVRLDDDSIGFRFPSDLTDSTVHLHAGILSSRYASKEGKEELDSPTSMTREMLLYCFESKPRPISFGITGYSSSDFISYLYQDVAYSEMDSEDKEYMDSLELPDQIDFVADWMRAPISNHRNSARRHIRRRLRVLLDRKVVQIGAMQFDREVRTDMLYLFFKLLERDDDTGFTEGQLRESTAIRDDLNLLGLFCNYIHFKDDERRLREFLRVRCPSLVSDFSSEVIDLPRRSKKTV